ncbi:MAG TPA: hypothetical protein VMW41_04130 [Candidatus Bathyarchaeia archaeon]|nr:hypothetical protein [Candidatus Bathyarchaeia archaeon]
MKTKNLEKISLRSSIINYPFFLFSFSVVIIGIILRFLSLTKRGSFVFDEYFTVLYTRDFSNLKKLFFFENSPPFYYLLSFFWQKVLPANEINSRLLPFFISLLQLPAVIFLAKKIETKKEAILGAVILNSISPFLIYFSGFGRMYSLLALISTLYYSLLLSKPFKYRSLWLLVSGVLLSLTHLFGIFLIVSGYIPKLFLLKSKEKRKKLSLILFLTLIPTITWAILELPNRGFEDISQSWYLKTRINPTLFLDKIISSFSLGLNLGLLHFAILVVLVTIFMQNFIFEKTKFSKLETNKLLTLFTGFFITSIAGMLANINVEMYYIGIVPLVLVFVNHFIWRKKIISPYVLTFCLVILMLPHAISIVLSQKKACWDKASYYITQNEKEGEQILIAPFFRKIVFDYYYLGKNQVAGLGSPEFQHNDQNIISSNWKEQFTQENITLIAKKIKKTAGFLLIRERENANIFDNATLIIPKMTEQGFQFDKSEYFDCSPDIWVYHFQPRKD